MHCSQILYLDYYCYHYMNCISNYDYEVPTPRPWPAPPPSRWT